MPPFNVQSSLVIQFLGGFHIRTAGSATPVPLAPRLRDLLVILASQPGKLHPRESLMTALWRDADEDHARRCLRSALWRLRRVLEPEGVAAGRYLKTDDAGFVCFLDDSDAFIDSVAFDRLLGGSGTSAPPEVDAGALRRAVDLYRGEFAPGCHDDWVLIERERFRDRFIAANLTLAQHYTMGRNYEDALACCRSVLNEDPLRETIHRQMLTIYGLSGRRTEAMVLYRWLTQRLRDELDVAPMPETQALYRAVTGEDGASVTAPNAVARRAPVPATGPSGMPSGQPDLQAALHRVENIIRDAEALRSSLRLRIDRSS